jgi:acetyl-CoA acetyltransferase family protein
MLKPDEPFARGVPKTADSTIGWRFVNSAMPSDWTISMGETAERVAARYGITRAEQDAFALESQQRTARALSGDVFADELVPVETTDAQGRPTVIERDEHPRPETTAEALAALRPAFAKEGGTVTAGSASGINDGASAVLVLERGAAERAKLRPIARILASAVAGVAPDVMGIGPVPATRKALERAGLSVSDLDVVELNEAFAAQAIACIRDLDLDPARVNVNGGAIALGHPLGSSGARIMTALVHELRRRKARYGLATMCIGVGQGIATIVERVE